MNDLIRTDTLFGRRVNIVGNISADLVLESLGKIYIKSRNKAKTLEEFITSLVVEDPNVSTSRTLVVEGIDKFDMSGIKDGTFIFDKLSNILYIYLDEELIELINVAPEGTGYVKRSGDTMTGRLAIYVKDGPPLYVNSTTLVENLNAQYLNGETAASFTRRNKDERIGGKWTFTRPTVFEANTLFEKDIVANASIGSSSFSSGFAGYGWRMDADTNTLTVDNLVVRKLMQVYELVVNKISATNGSLWITNAGKVVSALKLEIKENSFFNTSASDYSKFSNGMPVGYAFIRLTTSTSTLTILGDYLSGPGGETDVPDDTSFWDLTTLQGARLIVIKSSNVDLSNDTFNNDLSDNYHYYKLFSDDFLFNCTLPIITRKNYHDWKRKENLKRLKQDLLERLEQALLGSSEASILLSEINVLQSLIDAIPNFNINTSISFIKSYFKYFGNGDFYYVNFNLDELPVFKPGDIVRCLKWTYNGIKYYDGVICNVIGNSYVIQVAQSILDKKTTITYDSSLEASYVNEWEDKTNYDLYKQSSRTKTLLEDPDSQEGQALLKKTLIGIIEKDDSIVLMGNLWDTLRQNAVYITSTDNGAPYIDVLSGVNRPDYSVIYYVPVYKTIKLNKFEKGSISGMTYLVDIPYTGNYYILDSSLANFTCDYTYFLYNDRYYLGTGKITTALPEGAVLINYLNRNPNLYTSLGDNSLRFNILLESGGKILMHNNDRLALQEQLNNITITSTRTTKTRLGNLDGIQDEIFPIDRQPYGYGLYGQNVFLTGEFYLNNGQAVADIGKEAITFAIASSKAGKESLNILERDLKRADKLLKDSVYTKGELLTAGMRIGTDSNDDPGIILWGNKIVIATSLNELVGDSAPTALFADGKIQAKFIAVSNAHSIFGVNPQVHVILVEYTVNGQKFYKEEVILSEEVEVDGETTTRYYYELSYPKDNQPAETLIEYTGDLTPNGYATYGWNLEAAGDGYLASGKINWTLAGAFNINLDDNAALIVKSGTKEKFKVSNTTIRGIDDIIIDRDNKTIGSTICSVPVYEGVPQQNCNEGTQIEKIIDLRNGNALECEQDQLISVSFTMSDKVEFANCDACTSQYNNNQGSGTLSIIPYWFDFENYWDTVQIDLLYTSSEDLLSPLTNYDERGSILITTRMNRTVNKKLIVNGTINAIRISWEGHKLLSFNISGTIKKLDFKAEIGSNFFSTKAGYNIFAVSPDGIYSQYLNTIGSEFYIGRDSSNNGLFTIRTNGTDNDCGIKICSLTDSQTGISVGKVLLINGDETIDLIRKVKDFETRITALEPHA